MVMLSHVKIVVCICIYGILNKILFTLNGYTDMFLGLFFFFILLRATITVRDFLFSWAIKPMSN